MHKRPGESKQPWLLIKADDEAARRGSKADILDEMPLSVVTGRSIPEIAEGKGRKRVWNSNRSAQDNVKAGATEAGATPRQKLRASRASANGKAAAARKSQCAHQDAQDQGARQGGEGARTPPTRRCPTSCRRRSRRCAPSRPTAPAGCTR